MSNPNAAGGPAPAAGSAASAAAPLVLPFQPPPGFVPVQYVDPATGKTFVYFQPAGAPLPGGVAPAAPAPLASAVPNAAALPSAMVISPPSASAVSAPVPAPAAAPALAVDAGGANAMVDDAPGAAAAGALGVSKPPSPSHSDAGGRERGSSSGSLAPPGSNRGDRASPPPPQVAAAVPAAAAASAALAVSPGSGAAGPFAHHQHLSLSSIGSGAPKGSPLSQPKPPRPDVKEMPTIKLGGTSKERAYYDNLSDLFSIVVTMEHLEKAYVRESIDGDEYTKSCKQLLAQFKTCKEALKDLTDMEKFYRDYHLESCRQAIQRLKEGVPATVLHGGDGVSAGAKASQLHVFHAVQHFITTMDSLKLEQRAVDELHPNLSDLMNSLNKVVSLPPEHDAKAKVKQWLLTLGQMKAHDELSTEQVRQMSFDLENAYNAFHRFVEAEKK